MTRGDDPVVEAMLADGPATTTDELAAQVIAGFTAAGATLATAESVTGGGLCAALTDVPGSSQVVLGSVVSYATVVKEHLLGVDGALLSRRGAVDAEVAEQMARGVAALLGSGWAVATTGSAGPDPAAGGSANDPVEPGTVFIAIASPDATWVEQLQFTGDRAAIRSATVDAALRILVRTLIHTLPTSPAIPPTPPGAASLS